MPGVMAEASVCVYPSLIEALPVVWLETMAMGKAVVASRTGPGPEIIEDGVSGLLCDPRDSAAIANRVIAVLTKPELRRRLELAARATAVERYAADTLAARNERFYRQCVAERRPHA
jgi:glycosyltransferase involved in cell wall biosynthesis